MMNLTWRKAAPITTGITLTLIIAGALVKTISKSKDFSTLFISCAAVIIAAFVAAACIRLYKEFPGEKVSTPMKIGFCTASFFAIGQNLVFMGCGLYRSLTTFDTAGMTLAAIVVSLVVYLIDTAITVYGIKRSIEKPWGMIVPIIIACAGANLISVW